VQRADSCIIQGGWGTCSVLHMHRVFLHTLCVTTPVMTSKGCLVVLLLIQHESKRGGILLLLWLLLLQWVRQCSAAAAAAGPAAGARHMHGYQ